VGTDVAAAAQRWAEQLVDLSGRNNLLFYRRLKVGTLDLVDPDPSAFDKLLRGASVRSNELSSTPEDAARRLRVIARTAQVNYEEKGLRTSHLALGLASWLDEARTTPNAPLLLAPVAITPRGAGGAEWDLVVDGDWVLNPTLVFKLRADFGVTIELPEDLDPAGDGFDPADAAAIFAKLQDSLDEVPGFVVTDAALIGNFSYNRQPMVDDLSRSVDQMAAHPLIKALAGDQESAAELIDRHPEIGLDAPDHIEPRHEFLVLDADASQHHVINAVVSGADMVVLGPPGTGKSQTISNLIATLVSYRKSVLFVAQKRAAIDAVTRRLDGVGLDNLVMDLHDGTGSRKRIAGLLAEALATVGGVPAVQRDADDAELVMHRSRLNAHSDAVNKVRDPWGVTVFDLQAQLLSTEAAFGAGIRLGTPVLQALTLDRVRELSDQLAEWVNLGGPRMGDPVVNPWAAAYGRLRSPDEAQGLLASAEQLQDHVMPLASEGMRNLLAELGLREPGTLQEWSGLFSFLDEVAALLDRLSPQAWDVDTEELIRDLDPSGSAARAAAATLFTPRYRRAKKAAAALATDGTDDPRELRELLLHARSLRQQWAAACTDGGPPRLAQWGPEARNRYQQLREQLAALGAWVGSLDATAMANTAARLAELRSSREQLYRMPRSDELEQHLRSAGLDPVLASVRSTGCDASTAAALLQAVWVRCVLEHIAASDPNVGAFTVEEQDRRREAYVRADRAHIDAGRQRVQRAWAEWVHDVRSTHRDQEQLLAREAAKKTRHKALRDLFAEAPELLQALRPCWTMSPLVVSQLLPSLAGIFDVVVFDEASQVLPAEAIPALMRGQRAVVAGDTKQLPPTTFFDQTTAVEDLEDSGVDAVTDDMESILDAMSALLPVPKGTRTLTWHYRSQDERLIAFSNMQASLYRGSMVTFPGVVDDAVTHERVNATAAAGNEESVAEEVRRVVELMVDHARRRPGESLGVIALGIKHADRIDLAVRARRAEDPAFDEWMSSPEEPAFIKNLERVQGDERDAIILSLGFGKGADGRLRHHFGPINQAGGERRLNVAITRARRRITVVSAFGSTDLDPAKLHSEGPQMLRRYIEYVESGGERLGSEGAVDIALNPFESDMLDRLRAAGIPVHPQYGVSGYRIDFALAHPEQPGRMVLAVEADGASYHSSPTARERDRLRQEHLERLGWRFCRVWSTSWFRDRDAEVARVVQEWTRACADADTDADAEAPRSAWVSEAAAASTMAPESQSAEAIPLRVGPCPVLRTGGPIIDYTTAQLSSLIRWIDSDTLLRSDDEVIDEVMAILGFQRRGPRIMAAITTALRTARPGGR
jgi:very-short-patch-repair endonuclease